MPPVEFSNDQPADGAEDATQQWNDDPYAARKAANGSQTQAKTQQDGPATEEGQGEGEAGEETPPKPQSILRETDDRAPAGREGTEDQSKADRAKIAADRARKSAHRQRETIATQERLSARNMAADQEITRLRNQAQQAEDFQKRLYSDPLGALRALGVTPKQISDQAVMDGTPESLIRQIQDQLNTERQERIRLQEQIQGEKAAIAREQAIAQGEKTFLRTASNFKLYPNLSKEAPEIQLNAVYGLIAQLERKTDPNTGRKVDASRYSYHELASFLDLQYAKGSKNRNTTTLDAKGKQTVKTQNGSQVNGQAGKRPQITRTLTQRDGTAKFRSTVSDEDAFLKLPDHEQRRILAENYKRQIDAKGGGVR